MLLLPVFHRAAFAVTKVATSAGVKAHVTHCAINTTLQQRCNDNSLQYIAFTIHIQQTSNMSKALIMAQSVNVNFCMDEQLKKMWRTPVGLCE